MADDYDGRWLQWLITDAVDHAMDDDAVVNNYNS
jgi:hypothetical protein